MDERIHLMVAAEAKARYRTLASRAGKTLSEWLREAAAEKAAEQEAPGGLHTRAALERFFDECDAREPGDEPDWATHREVIERSKGSGAA